jgi:sphingolipid 4-desaturase/C4-monooxygenase
MILANTHGFCLRTNTTMVFAMNLMPSVLKGEDVLNTTVGRSYRWVTNGEPHAIRRREILNKYGDEVKKLYGYDTKTAWIVFGVVVSQFVVAYAVRGWSWAALAVVSYVVSGTLNQNLFCAQHEISHCLAFRKPSHNKLLALFANLPLVVPVAVKFREYHHDHHLFLGVDGGDVDLPTVFESSWIRGLHMKLMYGFVYLIVYGVRPLIVRPKPAHMGDVINWIVVMGTNAVVLYFWGIKSLVYLFAGSILGGGIHPLAGHLIAEHYMFDKGQETYSYYGPLNALSYNVGYHNEHHDFPQIPQTRLHKLKKIAPEYYENMYQHSSWTWVLYKFLTDSTMGPWSRMHRLSRNGTGEGNEKYIAGNCRYGADMDSAQMSDESSTATSVVPQSPGRAVHTKNDSAMLLNTNEQKLRQRRKVHTRSDSAIEDMTSE